MIIVDTLNVTVTKDSKLSVDGLVVNSIYIRDEADIRRTLSHSPKHRQSFLSGNLMVSDEKGLIYVPVDEVNKTNEYIVLGLDGNLSRMPTLHYETYVQEKKEFDKQRLAKTLAEETEIKK